MENIFGSETVGFGPALEYRTPSVVKALPFRRRRGAGGGHKWNLKEGLRI